MIEKYIDMLNGIGESMHLNATTSLAIAESITFISLLVIGLLLYFLARFIISKTVHVLIKRTPSKYDDLLIKKDSKLDGVLVFARSAVVEDGFEGCMQLFCTDSIAFEYIHLDEIRAAGAELIEMETALFYQLADLFEVPAVALLAVSDNAATGAPLLGREELGMDYRRARGWAIPDLIYHIAKEES